MGVRHNGPLCDMKKDREGMMSDVKKSCIEHIKGWSSLQPADITVRMYIARSGVIWQSGQTPDKQMGRCRWTRYRAAFQTCYGSLRPS